MVLVLGWAAVVLVAPSHAAPPPVHAVALFAHLASLVLGFGAVLLVDWFGVLWVLGRRTLTDVLRTAAGAHVPTWAGFAGLLVSGAFLGPAATPLTAVKLVAVLVVGLNGMAAGVLLRRLRGHAGDRTAAKPPRGDRLPAGLLLSSLLATAVSQLAWWTAVVIGFLNSRGR